jgi:hypothetical protein
VAARGIAPPVTVPSVSTCGATPPVAAVPHVERRTASLPAAQVAARGPVPPVLAAHPAERDAARAAATRGSAMPVTVAPPPTPGSTMVSVDFTRSKEASSSSS